MKKIKHLIGLTLYSIITSNSAHSEIITLWNEQVLHGSIKGFSESIVKFYTDRDYAIELIRIRDARVDDDAKGVKLEKQQLKIDELLFVINREDYLSADIQQTIKKLFLKREFEKIDEYAEFLRISRERYPSGRLKIYSVYEGIKSGLEDRDISAYEERVKLIRQWIQEHPSSITAKISLMSINISYAWAYRGAGYSNTVTGLGNVRFKQKLKEVISLGESLRKRKIKDPAIYRSLIVAYNGYGSNKKVIIQLAGEAANIVTGNISIYDAAMTSLLPKWGGSTELLLEFLRTVTSGKTKNDTPEMYYILVKLIKSEIEDQDYMYYDFDWNMIQNGFKAYEKKYFVVDKDVHLMAKLASLHGDRVAARKYFAATSGQWNHYAKSIWSEKLILAKFKSWSREEPDLLYEKALSAILLGVNVSSLNDLLKNYIEVGGDINQGDVFGNTLLHHAVKRYDYELAVLLMTFNADVNRFNAFGSTPLHLAVEGNNQIMVELLLKGGADSALESRKVPYNAAHIAAGLGFFRVVKILVDSNPALLNSKNVRGYSMIHVAALGGYNNVVKVLLDYPDIQLNSQTTSGNTPLHLAVERGHTETTEILLVSGADPNVSNLSNHTVLSLAKENNFPDIVNILNKYGSIDSYKVITRQDKKEAIRLVNEGSRYFNQVDYKKAKDNYIQAIALDKNNASVYHSLALVNYQFEKAYEEADRNIKKSIELDPGDAESYYIAGRINHMLNRPEIYKAYFRKYVAMAPDTYNTRDLKENYSSFLNDDVKAATNLSEHLEESLWLQLDKRYLLLALLLLLALALRLRKSN